MRVSDSSGNVVRETEIFPKDKANQIWGTEIAHIITNEVPETFQILIYTEFGTATATTTVTLLETKPIVEPELFSNTESESKLPEWVRAIFVWYAEGTIGEAELINALQFLIKEGIIKI